MSDIRQVLATFHDRLNEEFTGRPKSGPNAFERFSMPFIRGFWNGLIDDWGPVRLDAFLTFFEIPHDYPKKVDGPAEDLSGFQLLIKNVSVYTDAETGIPIIRGEDIIIGFEL